LHIIHGDFKPANAFVTRDGAIKVLNFGMAQVARLREQQDGTNDEAFAESQRPPPATSLPYMSCERCRGDDPDPRDDVYALAVVSYELLAGRHPFNGWNAVEARDSGQKPHPVAGLPHRQWHTLQSALAFTRDKRPPDAKAFSEGMTPKRRPVNLLVFGGLVLTLVVVAGSLLTSNMIERRQVEAISSELASPDPLRAAEAVQKLLAADQSTVATVLSQEGAANAVLTVFKRRARALFDPAQGRNDFQSAKRELANAKRLLKDSASLGQFEATLDAEQITSKADAPAVVLVSSRDSSDFGPLVLGSGARGFIPKGELSGAAIAELIAARTAQRAPAWTNQVGSLPTPVYLVEAAAKSPRMRARLEQESPEPLRKRNIFAPPGYLEIV